MTSGLQQCKITFNFTSFFYPLSLTDICLHCFLFCCFFSLFILKSYTLVHRSHFLNSRYQCKIYKIEVTEKGRSICCDIFNVWSHNECVNLCPKTYEKLHNDNLPACVTSLPCADLRTKELGIFLSSDPIEQTLKRQETPKKP